MATHDEVRLRTAALATKLLINSDSNEMLLAGISDLINTDTMKTGVVGMLLHGCCPKHLVTKSFEKDSNSSVFEQQLATAMGQLVTAAENYEDMNPFEGFLVMEEAAAGVKVMAAMLSAYWLTLTTSIMENFRAELPEALSEEFITLVRADDSSSEDVHKWIEEHAAKLQN